MMNVSRRLLERYVPRRATGPERKQICAEPQGGGPTPAGTKTDGTVDRAASSSSSPTTRAPPPHSQDGKRGRNGGSVSMRSLLLLRPNDRSRSPTIHSEQQDEAAAQLHRPRRPRMGIRRQQSCPFLGENSGGSSRRLESSRPTPGPGGRRWGRQQSSLSVTPAAAAADESNMGDHGRPPTKEGDGCAQDGPTPAPSSLSCRGGHDGDGGSSSSPSRGGCISPAGTTIGKDDDDDCSLVSSVTQPSISETSSSSNRQQPGDDENDHDDGRQTIRTLLPPTAACGNDPQRRHHHPPASSSSGRRGSGTEEEEGEAGLSAPAAAGATTTATPPANKEGKKKKQKKGGKKALQLNDDDATGQTPQPPVLPEKATKKKNKKTKKTKKTKKQKREAGAKGDETTMEAATKKDRVPSSEGEGRVIAEAEGQHQEEEGTGILFGRVVPSLLPSSLLSVAHSPGYVSTPADAASWPALEPAPSQDDSVSTEVTADLTDDELFLTADRNEFASVGGHRTGSNEIGTPPTPTTRKGGSRRNVHRADPGDSPVSSPRLVCFADEAGKPMERVFRYDESSSRHVDVDLDCGGDSDGEESLYSIPHLPRALIQNDDGMDLRKLVILCLLDGAGGPSSSGTAYEFLHVAHHPSDHVTVRDLLETIPALATDPALASAEFQSLHCVKGGEAHEYKARAGPRQRNVDGLDEQWLTDCRFRQNELLVASLRGGPAGVPLLTQAGQLMSDPKVRQAMKRSVKSGVDLKVVTGSSSSSPHHHRQGGQDEAGSDAYSLTRPSKALTMIDLRERTCGSMTTERVR
jgi:hypothetical protein